jgi:hypothetical protein
VGLAILAVGARAASDKTAGQPWVSVSLNSLGVPAMPQQLLSYGLSLMTVNFVDDTHLLVTFGTRDLIPRLKDDPPTDDDRMVAAELVELPSGNVLARTEWHMHDHSQYLWRLGHGRFLVRSRNTLFALTPLAHLNTPDPLQPLMFPGREGRPVAALLSPDASLVMVETLLPQPEETSLQTSAGAAAGLAGVERRPAKLEVAIDFYRIAGGDESDQVLSVLGAGVVKSQEPIMLPIDHDGYLLAGDPTRDRWPVSFNEYDGKELPAAKVDSSCVPRLQMVSRFEFLAFACAGSADRVKLKAYGMDGHETWEEAFGPMIGQPVFAFAPKAGRFAMSRIVSSIGDAGTMAMIPDGATQEVRVYQTESGDLLLKAPCSPVERNAENFDLSADGLLAAAVNNGAIQVYRLPEPSDRDVKDLKVAAGFAPPAFDGPVELRKISQPVAGSAAETTAPAHESAAAAVAAPVAPAAPAQAAATAAKAQSVGDAAAGASQTAGPSGPGGTSGAAASGQAAEPTPVIGPDETASGDAAPGGHRKAPTLLEPGEQAEFKGGVAQKQPE